jgi:putative DNA primase/helicase
MKLHFADSGNADRLVVLHGADLRYCYTFRKWLRWDGRRWMIDDVGHAVKLAKRTMVAFLHQAIEAKKDDAEKSAAEKFARGSLDARRLNAALALAQPELAITPAELDRGAHLLNFTNGTVDLKTGKLLPHRRSHWLTRMVHHPYRAAAVCPGWLAFLDQIMGGGPDAGEGDQERARELVDYMQLALGYSITADVSEKAVFFAYGSGDNGKTTMLAIVRDLTKEYSVTIALDILTARNDSNNVASARASLMGARLAVSSETEEGQRLSPARLKRICQGSGGEIEACRKYENQITFPESHKLWVDANHKPELPATEASVWNRVHLIPFTVTIPKHEQDRGLKDRLLKDEAEGILAWLVQGAKLWYEKGLPSSKTVAAATEEWRASLDRVQDFLEEHTLKAEGDDKEAYILAKDLYASYRRWCEENSERPLSEPRFRGQMTDMKFGKEKKHEGKAWLGLRFRPPPENG